MPPFIDLTGQRFGRLLVVSRDDTPRISRFVYWLCLCECGNHKSVRGQNLKASKTRSCGCLHSETAAAKGYAKKTHGKVGSPEYVSWKSMKNRCLNPQCKDWPNYGARGITVCAEWLDSFEAFYAHVGDKPGPNYSIDRIDNNAGYRPGNVRWATPSEQARNKRPRRKKASP